MQRNVTLTVDENLLREARKVALDRNTSVNQLVREFLEQLVRGQNGRKQAAERLKEMFRTSGAEVGPITWTRDDLHERGR